MDIGKPEENCQAWHFEIHSHNFVADEPVWGSTASVVVLARWSLSRERVQAYSSQIPRYMLSDYWVHNRTGFWGRNSMLEKS